MRGGSLGVALVVAAALTAGCGKKGPPLPPLVKLPVAPPDFTAERRGDVVTLQFNVPAENTDRTKPANVERVDVYALTGPTTVNDEQLLKRGTRVASVAAKAPRDPNDTTEPDEPADDEPELEGDGLDQGATAHVDDQISAESLVPVDLTKDMRAPSKPSLAAEPSAPLLGPSSVVPSRTYVAVGVNKNGRRGPLSKRVPVPLVPPPPAPASPAIAYDEHTITVTWSPPEPRATAAVDEEVLPSKPIGPPPPTLSYNVYQVRPSSTRPSPDGAGREVRLTEKPLTEPRYTDTRIEWGAERCYAVRAVETVGALTIESEARPPRCEKLVDTFPPAVPKRVTAVTTEGAISLIWDPNEEPDMAGYFVLRGTARDKLEALTPMPIQDTTFKDIVQPGTTYYYAVQAIDKSGNKSAPSEPVEETAR